MVFSTAYHRIKNKFGSYANAQRLRRQLLACTVMGTLAGCTGSGENPENLGKIGYVKGFLGAVVSDEPQSARVGRDILSAGGSAADAVAAMYFTASVTMPATASLGGGGVCVYHDTHTEKTEALDFLSKAPKSGLNGAERPVGVPMNARGFFILHSRYGDLPWASIVAPGEKLARFGVQVSRALAAELKPVGDALVRDPEAARFFAHSDGTPVQEGDFIKQFDLAASLTELRTKGPGAMYIGPFSKRFIEAVKNAGGNISEQDLREALPVWRETVKGLDYDYKIAHFPPPAAAGGVVGAEMWSMLATYGNFDDANESLRAHLLAETAMRSYGDRAGWVLPDGQARKDYSYVLNEDYIEKQVDQINPSRHQAAATLNAVPQATPESPSALSLVAVDRFGSAVACNVSMNNAFGVGRIAPGTGIMMSALPGVNGRGPMSLGPMVVVNPNSNEVYFAGAASRGVAAPTALLNVAARSIMAAEPLASSIMQPRTHHGGSPDKLFYENRLDQGLVNALRSQGYDMASVPALGLVNAVYCSDGLRVHPGSCQVANDPRGYGLSLGAQ